MMREQTTAKSVCIAFFFFCLQNTKGDKMREWMGPTNFLGGQLPIERQGHGLVSLNVTKFALFAGTNAFFGDILPPFNNKFRGHFILALKYLTSRF